MLKKLLYFGIAFYCLLTSAFAQMGIAHMFPGPSQAWTPNACYQMTDPWGNPIPCPNTTTSQGFIEFVTYAQNNGFNAEVDCLSGPIMAGYPGPAANSPGAINFSGTNNLPPLTIKSLVIRGCVLAFQLSGQFGLVFDTLGAYVQVDFIGGGFACYDSNPSSTYPYVVNNVIQVRSWCVLLHPRTPLPGYGLTQMLYSRINFPSFTTYSTGPTPTMGSVGAYAGDGQFISLEIGFVVSNGENNSRYSFLEYGNNLVNGGCQQTMTGVHIHGLYVTNNVNVGINLGAGEPCANQIKLNHIDVTEYEPVSGTAIQDFGSGTHWEQNITLDPTATPPMVGITVDASARNNNYRCRTPVLLLANNGQVAISNPTTAYNASQGCINVNSQ